MHLIVITAAVLTGFLALMMIFFYFSQKTFPGFGQWTMGGCLISFGYLMMCLRGVLPTSFAIVIQNFAFPLAAVFYLGGMRNFFGLADMSLGWYAFPVVNALFSGFSVYWLDSAAWRMLFVSLTFSVPHLFTATLVLRDYAKARCLFSLVAGTEMVLATGVLAVWTVWSFEVADFNVLAEDPVQLGFYIAFMVLQVVITVSLIMLNAERLNRDLSLAQDALRFSEEKYSKAFHSTPDAITISRMSDGKIVEVNEAFSFLTGYSKAEALEGTTVVLNLWLDDRDRDKVVTLLRDQKTIRDREVRFRAKSGKIMDCLYSGEIILLGQELHVLSIVRDITKRKRTEEERENFRAQLLQSQKMQAVGTLAAGIAHDFNNMLQVILGYADLLLLDKKIGDPDHEHLQNIIKTSKDARDLIQKIRVFSRKADIQPIPMDLNKNVSEVANILTHTLPKTVEIYINLDKNLALINADYNLMSQMVMNLAINAGEAMPDGGTLTIATENVFLDKDFCKRHLGLEPGPHILFTNSDTGRGIAREQLDRLFDPFYSTKTRDYHKGTGLGLPVVQGIVELHKGYVDVSSEVGKGTTFRIYIPAMETCQFLETVEDFSFLPKGNETILLVEDEEMVRNLGKETLEQSGYKILTASDGQEAVEVYEKEKDNISLVILDIIMPRMDGKQCLQEILRINPNAKILVSSGVVEGDLVEDLVNLGAKGSIMKPFGINSLLQSVRAVLYVH
jgi:two-component system, cell cycle sensor histidine kinase and response regulator CckA